MIVKFLAAAAKKDTDANEALFRALPEVRGRVQLHGLSLTLFHTEVLHGNFQGVSYGRRLKALSTGVTQ